MMHGGRQGRPTLDSALTPGRAGAWNANVSSNSHLDVITVYLGYSSASETVQCGEEKEDQTFDHRRRVFYMVI